MLVVEATEGCDMSFCYKNNSDILDLVAKETYMLSSPTVINEEREKSYSVQAGGVIMGASHLSFVTKNQNPKEPLGSQRAE